MVGELAAGQQHAALALELDDPLDDGQVVGELAARSRGRPATLGQLRTWIEQAGASRKPERGRVKLEIAVIAQDLQSPVGGAARARKAP